MKKIYWLVCFWFTFVLLAAFTSLASVSAFAGEVFLPKNRDSGGVGEELNRQLNKIKSDNGIILYSGCHDKYGIVIFIVSNVLKQGILLEFTGVQLESLAPVDLKGYEGIMVGDMLGGRWVVHRAQYNIDQLVKMPFYIFSGKNPAELFDVKFPQICRDYSGD